MHKVLLALGCLLAVLLAIGVSQAAAPIDYDGYCIPKAIERQAIGDRDNMTLNADGSLDIYIQIEIDRRAARIRLRRRGLFGRAVRDRQRHDADRTGGHDPPRRPT